MNLDKACIMPRARVLFSSIVHVYITRIHDLGIDDSVYTSVLDGYMYLERQSQ